MIFDKASFFEFRVHLDPIFIKFWRFRALKQEKPLTKVIYYPFLGLLTNGIIERTGGIIISGKGVSTAKFDHRCDDLHNCF